MKSKFKITKADKRKKAKSERITHGGSLSTSWGAWSNAGHESKSRAALHVPKLGSKDKAFCR